MDPLKKKNSHLIQELLEKLAPFRKTAYIPKTRKSKKTFDATSKIGGYPYLINENDWPTCASCGDYMPLFVQLNLDESGFGKGLIQLFHCINEESDCTAVVPRRIDVGGESAQKKGKDLKAVSKIAFPQRRVIEWKAVDDYPAYDELSDLGVSIDDDDYRILERSGKGICLFGDKLFGWPHWLQSVSYPVDGKTGSKMSLLFQIDSEINLPYMFGDTGIGYLMQSPDDEDELSFQSDIA